MATFCQTSVRDAAGKKNPAQRKAPTWSGSDVLLSGGPLGPTAPSSATRSPDRDRAVRAEAGEGSSLRAAAGSRALQRKETGTK